METNMHASMAEIRANAHDTRPPGCEPFTVLEFEQGADTISIFLPIGMSACASMIAGAFNAHIKPSGLTVVAQEGANSLDRGMYIGLVRDPVIEDPAGRFEDDGGPPRPSDDHERSPVVAVTHDAFGPIVAIFEPPFRE